MAAVAAEWLPPMLGNGADDSTLVALASMRVPTLLIAATRDTWSSLEQHQDMRALLPAAKLVIIEGAGHMAPVEAPDAVASALRRWLRGAQS